MKQTESGPSTLRRVVSALLWSILLGLAPLAAQEEDHGNRWPILIVRNDGFRTAHVFFKPSRVPGSPHDTLPTKIEILPDQEAVLYITSGAMREDLDFLKINQTDVLIKKSHLKVYVVENGTDRVLMQQDQLMSAEQMEKLIDSVTNQNTRKRFWYQLHRRVDSAGTGATDILVGSGQEYINVPVKRRQ